MGKAGQVLGKQREEEPTAEWAYDRSQLRFQVTLLSLSSATTDPVCQGLQGKPQGTAPGLGSVLHPEVLGCEKLLLLAKTLRLQECDRGYPPRRDI